VSFLFSGTTFSDGKFLRGNYAVDSYFPKFSTHIFKGDISNSHSDEAFRYIDGSIEYHSVSKTQREDSQSCWSFLRNFCLISGIGFTLGGTVGSWYLQKEKNIGIYKTSIPCFVFAFLNFYRSYEAHQEKKQWSDQIFKIQDLRKRCGNKFAKYGEGGFSLIQTQDLKGNFN